MALRSKSDLPRKFSKTLGSSVAVEQQDGPAYREAMPILVLEHSEPPGSGSIGRALIRHGLRLRSIRVGAGEAVPPDLDEVDAIVSLGGRQSATDDALPWIAAELRLLEAASKEGIPVLGICLGAQLLARALGGRVERMASPSIGLPQINLTQEGRDDPLFRGLPWFGTWPSWHQDEIVELPEGARKLAHSEACGVEGFAHGISAYGIQFHPEWTSAALVQHCEQPDPGLMGAEVDLVSLSATVKDNAESIDRQSERFSVNVASYLMPIERVNQGVAKDIHH